MPPDHSPPGYTYARSQNSSASSEGHDAFLSSHSATYPFNDLSGPLVQHNIHALSTSSVPPHRMPPMVDPSGNSGYHISPSHQTHSQSPTFSSSQSSHNAQNMWDTGRSVGRPDQARPASSWSILPALDTTVGRPRSNEMTSISSRSEVFSPQAPHRPWSSSTSSTASSSSGGASGSHYAGSSFPTLTSPFYPAQSPTQRHADVVSSPSTQSSTQDYFPQSAQHARRMSSGPHSGAQMHSGLTQSSTSSSAYMTASSSSQWTQYPRGSSDSQRSMPPPIPFPLQTSSASSASPSSSSASAQSAHMGYWDRPRYDGR